MFEGDSVDVLSQNCLASSYRQLASGALLEQYGPSSLLRPPGARTKSHTFVGSSWLYSAHRQAHTDSLLSDSLAAFSLAYHERQNALEKYKLGSRVLYGKAMNTLVRRLDRKQYVVDDSTLAAAMLLVQFEVKF